MKFRLGLFDDPFVDEDAAARTVGRQDFRDEGYAAQARSVTVLQNGTADAARRPAAAARAAHLRRERLARGGGRATACRWTGPRTPTSRWCG